MLLAVMMLVQEVIVYANFW